MVMICYIVSQIQFLIRNNDLCARQQPYLLNTFHVSALPKMADTMLGFVLDKIKYLTEDLGVTVIAWCTNAGGDAAKMR